MKNKSVQSKWDKDLVVCIGTDIPPIGTVELMIWGRLLELIEQKQTNILTMDDIFEGYTHTKAGRFDLLSRLVKKGIIRRNRIDNLHHEYVIIPKNTYRDSKEMRVYPIKTKAERLNVMREFGMNK